jgi:hypothetical protein
VNAPRLVAVDILFHGLRVDIEALEVPDGLLEIRLRALHFHDHERLCPGGDVGPQDVENEIEILDEPIDNGLVDGIFFKAENDPLLH